MAARLRFSAAKAYRHLRANDPVVAALIDRHGPYRPRPASDPYAALVRAIVYQQLAGRAAAAIHGRLLALSGDGETPEPAALLSASEAELRAVGLSGPKIGYLRDLASKVASGELDFRGIDALDDAEVTARLTAVKGIGEWSAHMFLMFELGRPDVLPVGDLGVRKGMQAAYRMRALPAPERMQRVGRKWAPYRSVGSWYMWRAAESVTPTRR